MDDRSRVAPGPRFTQQDESIDGALRESVRKMSLTNGVAALNADIGTEPLPPPAIMVNGEMRPPTADGATASASSLSSARPFLRSYGWTSWREEEVKLFCICERMEHKRMRLTCGSGRVDEPDIAPGTSAPPSTPAFCATLTYNGTRIGTLPEVDNLASSSSFEASAQPHGTQIEPMPKLDSTTTSQAVGRDSRGYDTSMSFA